MIRDSMRARMFSLAATGYMLEMLEESLAIWTNQLPDTCRSRDSRQRRWEIGASPSSQQRCAQGDIFQMPIDEVDVVALYLTAQALDGLRPKLESQLKQGTRIVCHDYEIKGWTPAKVEKMRTWRFWPHKIYLYVVQ